MQQGPDRLDSSWRPPLPWTTHPREAETQTHSQTHTHGPPPHHPPPQPLFLQPPFSPSPPPNFESQLATNGTSFAFTTSPRSSQTPGPSLYSRMDPYPSQPSHQVWNESPLSVPSTPSGLGPQALNGPSMLPPMVFGNPATMGKPSDPFYWQLPPNLDTKVLLPRPKLQRTCIVCIDSLDEELFPYKCTKCNSYTYCRDCLKSWFLDACQNESKMPPKCCSIIPVSAVAELLTTDEMELFKAKYEEWSTPDKLYCPNPICSTFISPRLYVKPSSVAKMTDKHVLCPSCATSVCTGCRSFSHINECPKSDLDAGLEEQLKKWKIKRCPKCRTGVKKVFGCSHVECGAHFCFECLLPIGSCDGSCEDDSENEIESDIAEDDLDARAGYHEDGDHDFGPEPYNSSVDTWGCHHVWYPSRTEVEAGKDECQLCFRHIRPISLEPTQSYQDFEGDVTMLNDDNSNWQCAGAHITCLTSSKSTMGDTTHGSYTCWCGTSYCLICQRNERAKGLELAHDCRCGMRICGACKEIMEA